MCGIGLAGLQSEKITLDKLGILWSTIEILGKGRSV